MACEIFAYLCLFSNIDKYKYLWTVLIGNRCLQYQGKNSIQLLDATAPLQIQTKHAAQLRGLLARQTCVKQTGVRAKNIIIIIICHLAKVM